MPTIQPKLPKTSRRKSNGTEITGNIFSKICQTLEKLSTFQEIPENAVPFPVENVWKIQTGIFV